MALMLEIVLQPLRKSKKQRKPKNWERVGGKSKVAHDTKKCITNG